ncbi:response regulator transcription factor [Candidatus Thiothrix sp. Deng01]|uniref:Response regulator transcription factor n=1 Tax=Candidatus Thiothrix phosphatis TaxID=3112415 RepID=A0ABU6CXR3_9GAMM|nr:response regulator transcription factor [Candidatus Thiothrix sp. Deng01]MEB4591611.1 response regulator transcription factor [Candidatus Thiothrix sp. Deng01]
MRLLLVEDDPMIGESLEESLHNENYAVDWVRDGHSAELALEHDLYDLVLLDLGLPGKQGLEVLTAYRKRKGPAAVLILTARDAPSDRVKGLDSGADDYLIKPFDLDELLARIRALLRRKSGRIQTELSSAGLVLNPATHEAVFRGQPLHLSAREFGLLQVLLETPGEVVSRARLEEKLYGWNEEIESNTVEVYIHMLRKKLGTDFIKNVRGVGYKVAASPA